jgi:hypothetical protein
MPGLPRLLLFCLLLVGVGPLSAQILDTLAQTPRISTMPEQDVIDAAHALLPRWKRFVPHQAVTLNTGGKFVWIIPQFGYTLQTSLLAQVLANVAFRKPEANVSLVIATATYTIYNQALFSLTSQVWGRQNRLLWIGDWRLMHYPQPTFGLGVINTAPDLGTSMDYQYLRVYQNLLRRVRPNFYAGIGYALDLHWDVMTGSPDQRLTQISGYTEGINGRSVSSGPTLRLLYDNRANAINATQGFYASVQYGLIIRHLVAIIVTHRC